MNRTASQASLCSKFDHRQLKGGQFSRVVPKTADLAATVSATMGVKCYNCGSVEGSEKPCPSTPPSPAGAPTFEKSSLVLPDCRAVHRKLSFVGDKYGRINQKSASKALHKLVPEGTLHLFNPGKSTQGKKRCAWITPQSDAAYVAYHDEEWGVPVHDDRRLFELLVFAGAQTEIAWSSILNKRQAYRDAFAQFDPAIIATYDTMKVASLKSQSDIMHSEARVQSIVSNAKLVMKLVEEFGSFDEYLWGYVNHKPIVNNYRQPKCIPVRTAKSEVISKDLQKRGFRHTGPMVVYSLMQAAGMANDHLLHCFRYHECNTITLHHHHQQSITTHRPTTTTPARNPRKPIVSPICC